MMRQRRINGVRFDGLHSYYDLDLWLSKRPEVGSPDPKTNMVEVPGSDGIIDMTEANSGETKYTNRTIIFTFAAMVDIDDQAEFKGRIMNLLHGKQIDQIVLDEDPDWYYSGRATVSFTDIKPWKLKCVVAIDAAPYAMRLEQTRVDLLNSGVGELQTYDFPTRNVTKQEWNTDLRLGTAEFPEGLSFPVGSNRQLIVSWPPNATNIPMQGSAVVYITDCVDGVTHTYHQNLAPLSAGSTRIAASTLTSNGLTLNEVYRVLVSGRGDCSIQAEFFSMRVRVWNERKNVIPNFSLVTDSETVVNIGIVVNGQTFTIYSDIATYPDIILKQGWNEILVPVPDPTDEVTSFEMWWREGRL